MVRSAARGLTRSPGVESRTRADGVSGAVETAFTWFARARSARAFHPVGVTFSGRLVITAEGSRLARAIAGRWPVQVRASKALGTRQGWPDIHGLALRLDHETGPVDLLFATVGRRIPYLLAPSVGWCSHPYTTFLPYTVDGERLIIRLQADRPDLASESGPAAIQDAVTLEPLTFAVLESAGRSWRPAGQLTLTERSDEEVSFDPVVNQHPRLRHSRLFAGLRLWAYVGSRRGRGATVTEIKG